MTQLGSVLQPLFRRFNELSRDGAIKEPEVGKETFEAVYGFMKSADFSEVQLTRQDMLFLLTTRLGELVRRPILHTLYAQQAAAEVDPGSKAGQKTKDMALALLQANGWSRFIQDEATRKHILQTHPNEGIFIDVAKETQRLTSQIAGGDDNQSDAKYAANDILTKTTDSLISEDLTNSTEALNRLMVHGIAFKRKYELLIQSGDYKKARFYSENGHAVAVGMDIRAMWNHAEANIIEKTVSGKKLKLKAKRTLMVVEDNPLHHLFFTKAEKTKRLTVYAPNKADDKSSIVDFDDLSMRQGFYKSAESALRTIDENVAAGGKPPDYLITDIELAGTMNGVELVKKIHEKYPDTVVFMVYSSNMDRYMQDGESGLSDLLAKDYVIGSWDKSRFTFEQAVDVMNKDISSKSLFLRARDKLGWFFSRSSRARKSDVEQGISI
jgi:hypothetical protein